MTPSSRLDHLRDHAASLRGRLLGVGEQAERARRERDPLAARIAALPRANPPAEPDGAMLAELARAERRLAVLDAEARDLIARWKAAARLVERCEHHLAATARQAA